MAYSSGKDEDKSVATVWSLGLKGCALPAANSGELAEVLSAEEGSGGQLAYVACGTSANTRGRRLVAVDVATGRQAWQFDTHPRGGAGDYALRSAWAVRRSRKSAARRASGLSVKPVGRSVLLWLEDQEAVSVRCHLST